MLKGGGVGIPFDLCQNTTVNPKKKKEQQRSWRTMAEVGGNRGSDTRSIYTHTLPIPGLSRDIP